MKNFALAAVLYSLSHALFAASVLVEDAGVLIGVDVLDVNNTLVDVRFEGGSYSSVFGTDQPFFNSFGPSTNQALAQAASVALRDVL